MHILIKRNEKGTRTLQFDVCPRAPEDTRVVFIIAAKYSTLPLARKSLSILDVRV